MCISRHDKWSLTVEIEIWQLRCRRPDSDQYSATLWLNEAAVPRSPKHLLVVLTVESLDTTRWMHFLYYFVAVDTQTQYVHVWTRPAHFTCQSFFEVWCIWRILLRRSMQHASAQVHTLQHFGSTWKPGSVCSLFFFASKSMRVWHMEQIKNWLQDVLSMSWSCSMQCSMEAVSCFVANIRWATKKTLLPSIILVV